MRPKNQSIYIFGWPSFVGGADTKLAHLISLLHHDFCLTLVPNDTSKATEEPWATVLGRMGVKVRRLDELPRNLNGFALAMSNSRFFTQGIAGEARDRGLKIIWSSEMMWHHPGELEGVKSGLVDKVLYTSEIQRSALEQGYGTLPSEITGNYIDPREFPITNEPDPPFTIGRLSRAAPEKYPEDFPVFYERLGLPNTRFRIMAWSEELQNKYKWHRFANRWDLLEAGAEAQSSFLRSLHLFVYPLGHQFVESWGRSTVEAMLSGAVPIVPKGHHLENLVIHGKTGFVCGDFEEFRDRCLELHRNADLRASLRKAARQHAKYDLCDRAKHLAIWKKVFEST